MVFKRILVVDDEEGIRFALMNQLKRLGYEAATAATADEALGMVKASPPDLILTDVRMPGMDGVAFLDAMREAGLRVPTIVMSAYGNNELAIQAIQHGAQDYISKPIEHEELVFLIRKTEERERLLRENRELRQQLQSAAGFERIVTQADKMQAVLNLTAKVADYKSTVLITGESGTGKELIARALHSASRRSAKPFIAINCGAIPEALLESELFGHMKGAFTDASQTKRGLFEEANGGTLFMDEIGELPLGLQVKILRVLQEQEIRRVGDTKDIAVNVRIVAATVRDLEAELKAGKFREDLYYRLNVVPIHLPPLRERLEDIPLLVNYFIKRFNDRLGRNIRGIAPDALNLLMAFRWPGNIRELENTIERAMVLTEADFIGPDALPDKIRVERDPLSAAIPPGQLSIKKATETIEIELIKRALKKTGGNRTRAAEMLEISHRALLYKIKEYGLGPAEPGPGDSL